MNKKAVKISNKNQKIKNIQMKAKQKIKNRVLKNYLN